MLREHVRLTDHGVELSHTANVSLCATCALTTSWEVASSVVVSNSPVLISKVWEGDGELVCKTDHLHIQWSVCLAIVQEMSSTDAVWLSPNNTVISSCR